MTVRIAIMVEGATETAFKRPLHGYLRQRLDGEMPNLDFKPADGRLPKQEKFQREVARYLRTYDAVIALTDVYTGSQPPDFQDATDAKAKMSKWVGEEKRFYPHAAQYEFEAWLLPYWERVRNLSGSNRNAPSKTPETVNHGSPPSTHLQEAFRTGDKKRRYSKVRDGLDILKDQDLEFAAAACPELRAFLDTILTLSRAP